MVQPRHVVWGPALAGDLMSLNWNYFQGLGRMHKDRPRGVGHAENWFMCWFINLFFYHMGFLSGGWAPWTFEVAQNLSI